MKKTEIVFLLDRSGSMAGLESDTIGGYNSFLERQRKLRGEVKITTVLFDSNYEFLHDGIDIKEVKPLTEKDYYVGSTTALMDAIGFTIQKISKRAKNSKVIFVITTDGMENASREFSRDKIKKLITSKKDWEFIYLGANIDAYQEGMSIGISRKHISNYKASGKCTRTMYNCLSDAVCKLANDEELDACWNHNLEMNNS